MEKAKEKKKTANKDQIPKLLLMIKCISSAQTQITPLVIQNHPEISFSPCDRYHQKQEINANPSHFIPYSFF